MRGSSAAEKRVHVPPPEMPMHPTRFESRSGRVSIQSIVRITSKTRQAIMVSPSSSVAPATEGHGLNSDSGHSVLDGLNGKVMLITGFIGAVAALLVDAHNVIDSAAVPRNAHHRRMRAGRFRREQIS